MVPQGNGGGVPAAGGGGSGNLYDVLELVLDR
ncbi:gas vesicle protein, partial [Streptomyces sp. NPDC006356]